MRAELKRLAAARAVGLVESDMTVGLGSGSTAAFALEAIAARMREGSLAGIRGVPTSGRTRELADGLGIPLADLNEIAVLDLTIDGADEVDPRMDLVKGGGGALLREKIVASATRRNVVVVDDSKLVSRLGERASIPVEVVRFGWRTHIDAFRALGADVFLRRSSSLRRDSTGEPLVTDEGHYILDCRFAGGISDPGRLDRALRARPGVVETGLFLGLARTLVVAGPDGVRVRERGERGAQA